MLAGRAVTMVLAVAVATAACGFHLRGSGAGSATLPPSLSQVRIVTAGAGANEPLAVAVREAMMQAGAEVVNTGGAPTLVVDEKVGSRVASVSTATAKASEYILQYTAVFRVEGTVFLAPQSIQLQRDYASDPAQVLVREQREQELLRDMRTEAAQQIVRRLARGLGSSRR